MITAITLRPGVVLRCFPDSRFRQGALSLQFVRPMCREEAALNALLPAVLLRGCEKYPDLRDITLRLDELYGSAVSCAVRRVGDLQTTGLYCSFMEDRFALPGDEVLRPMTELLQDLLRPGPDFRADFVEGEKKNLISTIDAQYSDKRAYAGEQLLKRMCREDSFGIPRLGEREAVAAITPEGLYQHLEKLLAESPAELFYVGSAPAERVAELLMPLFAGRKDRPAALPPQTGFRPGPGGGYTETQEIAQGRLAMGFTTPIRMGSGDFAAMQVANMVFGGGATSKLFMRLREKMSLCYEIGSAYYGAKGILTVSAGIDSREEDRVRREVLARLEDCRRGDISDMELESGKKAICSSLRATHDSPSAIENYYATAALSGLGMTPEEYIRAVEAVTREQAAEAAGTLALHTVFSLKGGRV